MKQTFSISELIFRRWCEKLRSNEALPRALVEGLESLHVQGKLSHVNEIDELLSQVGEPEQ